MIKPEDMLKFLKERRTIRRYADKMVPDEEIEMILEAGRWAPSASNLQPWKFIVIKNRELINKISTMGPFTKHLKRAPVVIAIVGRINEDPYWYIQDTSLMSMNMILMAWSLNIGTSWIGGMDRNKVKELLGLGKDDFLLTVLPFGYLKGAIPKPSLRKDLSEITEEIN